MNYTIDDQYIPEYLFPLKHSLHNIQESNENGAFNIVTKTLTA